ncbi:MAG: right-handed parallel beta-helix repeat-containing protein [Terriglobales bacterium]
MSKNCIRPFLFVGLVLAVCFAGQAAQASAVYVGTCHSGGVQYSTIQSAVNAVPPGSTVYVCPGNYPEQVTINKNLSLKGFASGSSGASIITSPSGGLVQNATGLGGSPIEAQIYVQAGATVTILGMTTDAANSQLDSLGCTADPVGIYYQRASGTIKYDSVLNDILSPDLTGCQGGLGILVESDQPGNSVSITNNNVENYQKNGITVTGLETGSGPSATISSNTVIGQGPWNGAGQNSIQLSFDATGTISSNTVGSDVWAPDQYGDTGDAAAGILVYASQNVAISKNNVSDTQYGIAIVSDTSSQFGSGNGAQISSNTISTTHLYDGIDLCSNHNSATSNIINGSDESAIHLDDTCGSTGNNNTVQSNTINSACAGVLLGTGTTGNSPSNTYYNTVNQTLAGDTCQPPPARNSQKTAAKSHGKFTPVRP